MFEHMLKSNCDEKNYDTKFKKKKKKSIIAQKKKKKMRLAKK